MIQRNLVNSILISIPVMVVVNRDILSLNVQTMKSKKREKKGKAKKAYIAWDDNDVSSSSASDDEEANLCLLASITSSVDSTSTSKGTTYDQLLNAFYETHDEAN